GAQLDPSYVNSPICLVEDTTDPERARLDYRPAAGGGHRAPHVWMKDGRSTLDLLDPNGFVLFDFGGDAAPVAAAAKSRAMPLKTVRIEDSGAAALFERKLVLVRPDGIVAWRGDAPPQDAVALIDLARGA